MRAHRRRVRALGLVASSALALASCSTVRVTRGVTPPVPPSSIAVLAFESPRDGDGAAAADGCTRAALEAGLRPVERGRLDALMREREVSRSGETGPEYYQRLGQLTGADAFVVGTIDRGDFGSSARATARLILSRSGDIAFMSEVGLASNSDDPAEVARRGCAAIFAQL